MATAEAIAAVAKMADLAAGNPGAAVQTLGSLLLNVIDEIAAAKRRIAALEATPFQYLGVHEPGKAYGRGQFVTASGSLWHCSVDGTTARPGESGSGWTLACKRGADGRDAR